MEADPTFHFYSNSIFPFLPFSREIILYLSNLQKINLFDLINKPDVIKGRSRTPKTSKAEFSMKIVEGLKL